MSKYKTIFYKKWKIWYCETGYEYMGERYKYRTLDKRGFEVYFDTAEKAKEYLDRFL